MIQWGTDYTRYREEKPSILDILFTKGINLEKNRNYECSFGNSDHLVLEIDKKIGGMEVKQEESYKKKSRNYGKAHYTKIKIYF